MNIKVLVLLLITLAFSTSSYSDSKKGELEWSEVPPIVQQTIIEHALVGIIKRIKKEEIILLEKGNKKTDIYLAKVKLAKGKNIWITVDKSGELNKRPRGKTTGY
ncbi:MAG: hypothetical protein H0X02_10370 [Nitrosomonas sp.]|nr:hypothetical protein [Nitrosomonas sp.]